MDNDFNIPQYRRDMRLEDKVSVTLTAAQWLGFLTEYAGKKWAGPWTNLLSDKALRALLDPGYLKQIEIRLREHEAAMSQQQDTGQALFKHFVLGQPPDVPPNMEGP